MSAFKMGWVGGAIGALALGVGGGCGPEKIPLTPVPEVAPATPVPVKDVPRGQGYGPPPGNSGHMDWPPGKPRPARR